MRLDASCNPDNFIAAELTLSRRNLEALLFKLDRPDSARTLYIGTDHGRLIVHAEENDEHYADRPCGPGAVDPREEARLSE